MNQLLQAASIFKVIQQWKKPLLIVGGVALIASAIFSGPTFIKPRFKSWAIVYPVNLSTYSQESPTELMIQLLESSDIQEKLISDFNLYKHYKIDTTDNEHQHTDVIKVLQENVTVDKTEYESVEIKVLDHDPKIASAMVDSILSHMNQKARNMQRGKTVEILATAQMRFDLKVKEMDSLQLLVNEYRVKYGLLDYGTQLSEYTRAYNKAMLKGNVKLANEAKDMLGILETKGGDFITLNDRLVKAKGTYNDFKMDVENLQKDMVKEWTYANIVTSAIPADKKTYPIRWLIVLGAVVSAEFFALLILMFYEKKIS
jgi:capsular polysaccharide biosynthesis protein